MMKDLMRKVRLPGFDLGRGGKVSLIESVLGSIRSEEKIPGSLFGKGGSSGKVLNLNQIQKQDLAACS